MEFEAKHLIFCLCSSDIFYKQKCLCQQFMLLCGAKSSKQTQDTDLCLSFKHHMAGKAMTLAYEDLCDKKTKERRQKEAPQTA